VNVVLGIPSFVNTYKVVPSVSECTALTTVDYSLLTSATGATVSSEPPSATTFGDTSSEEVVEVATVATFEAPTLKFKKHGPHPV
jgi:hypothetical protein